MPKKILFESLIHHMTRAAQRLANTLPADQQAAFQMFVDSWRFEDLSRQHALLLWRYPTSGKEEIDCSDAHFYTRGDTPSAVDKQKLSMLMTEVDEIQKANETYFDGIVEKLFKVSHQ